MVGMPVHKDEGAPGFRTLNPVAILRIEDADGRVLWEYGAETVHLPAPLDPRTGAGVYHDRHPGR